MYTRIQELIVWPCGFLKYTHKSQGVCILPHKMHIYLICLFNFGLIEKQILFNWVFLIWIHIIQNRVNCVGNFIYLFYSVLIGKQNANDVRFEYVYWCFLIWIHITQKRVNFVENFVQMVQRSFQVNLDPAGHGLQLL